MDLNILLSVIVAVATAGGAYAAIRADLARLHERTAVALQSAARAHDRLDKLHGPG